MAQSNQQFNQYQKQVLVHCSISQNIWIDVTESHPPNLPIKTHPFFVELYGATSCNVKLISYLFDCKETNNDRGIPHSHIFNFFLYWNWTKKKSDLF